MSKIDVYNQEAKVVKSIELSDAVFGIEPNEQAMYDTILAYLAGQRQGTHNTLTRAYVSGTGKKPFRQKGTGRARQGSTRATQWRHGAIAFGPHPRKYGFKLWVKARMPDRQQGSQTRAPLRAERKGSGQRSHSDRKPGLRRFQDKEGSRSDEGLRIRTQDALRRRCIR